MPAALDVSMGCSVAFPSATAQHRNVGIGNLHSNFIVSLELYRIMRRTWISTAAAAALTTGGAVGAWAQEKQPGQDQAPAMQMQNGQDQPTSATPSTRRKARITMRVGS